MHERDKDICSVKNWLRAREKKKAFIYVERKTQMKNIVA